MNISERDDDSPSSGVSSRFQPHPLKTRVARELQEGRWSTSIARLFDPEEVGRCQLCPSCTACRETGLCLIVARRFVADADAPLYRFVAPPSLAFVPAG